MAGLRAYWRSLNNEDRKQYAKSFGSSIRNTEQRYVCRAARRRQRPSIERMVRMMEGSNGAVTAEGLAYDFVIEPLNDKAKDEKAPASEG